MNANDVIQAYITDVARQLPRRQRNDVAFELRALLDEELHAKAEAAGRAPDAAMATELLRAFGQPTDVAARYRPGLVIIDPADGHAFWRATVVGMAIIWCLGLVQVLQPVDSASGLLTAAGQWWGGVVIASLWWPGLLVAYFGLSAWTRRRWPRTSTWTPRAADRIDGGRTALVMGVIGIACGLSLLAEPRWLLDVIWGGRAAPAAYEALTYTDSFLQHQAPWVFVLVALNIPIFATVIVNGRWTTTMRRVAMGSSLATCAVLAWVALDGPVFMAQASDRVFKGALWLIIAFTLADLGIKLFRGVRPAPNRQPQA